MLTCFLLTLIFAAIVSPIDTQMLPKKVDNRSGILSEKNVRSSKFMDYLDRFDPVNVIDSLNSEQKKRGQNFEPEDFLNRAFDKIDASPELMKLKVQNGNVKYLTGKDGRRNWVPPAGITYHEHDYFSLRPRLYELMKQAIYQARNKMVIMQLMREKYRKNSVYKMGFLTGKTDHAVKNFAMVSYRAFKNCGQKQQAAFYRFTSFDLMVAQDRLLHLWITVDLLKDLIKTNDFAARKVLQKYRTNRQERFKFKD